MNADRFYYVNYPNYLKPSACPYINVLLQSAGMLSKNIDMVSLTRAWVSFSLIPIELSNHLLVFRLIDSWYVVSVVCIRHLGRKLNSLYNANIVWSEVLWGLQKNITVGRQQNQRPSQFLFFICLLPPLLGSQAIGLRLGHKQSK